MVFFSFDHVKRHAKELVVLVPAIHLVVCFLYQFLYHHFFGHGIYNFGSASDAFALSLRDVFPIYLMVVFSVGLMTFTSMIMVKLASKNERIKQISFGDILIFAVIPGAIMAAIFYRYVETNYFDWATSGNLFGLIIGYWSGFLYLRMGPGSVLITIIILLLFTVTSGAARDAQRDGMQTFASVLKRDPARCGDFAVIKNFSEFWLVVAQDNRRSLVNSKCEEVFILIESRKFIEEPKISTLEFFKSLK